MLALSPLFLENQGTSRSSILGEVDVNLAEFAEAVKPVSIALPFRGCDFGTVLHVWFFPYNIRSWVLDNVLTYVYNHQKILFHCVEK
jgi:hypothetical protein